MSAPAVSTHWLEIGPFDLEVAGRLHRDGQTYFEYTSVTHRGVEVIPDDFFLPSLVKLLQEAAIDAAASRHQADNDEAEIDAYELQRAFA